MSKEQFIKAFETELPRGVHSVLLKEQTIPQATWASTADIAASQAMTYAPDHADGKILVGALGPKLIGIKDPRHVLTVAGSQTGKSVMLTANLLCTNASVICTDIKGELANRTARRRMEMGQDVHVLDPFEITSGVAATRRAQFNPLEILNIDNISIIEDAGAIAEALLERIQQQQREENDPTLKVLIFTEFVPTQAMLADFLELRGFKVVSLNGAMDLEERRQAQRRFATDAQILISTDAGGEGLNLQFCHVIVNYDLPWNPMKIEQRIGRVDRIGQKHIVRAMNFALADTVELRVREVLEEKLARILEEFGVDKLADVLDSEDGGVPFEALFAQAMIAPEDAEQRAAGVADEIRRRAEEARAGSRLLSATERLDPSAAQKIANHQMPYWTERMTLGYLRSQESAGASVKPAAIGYDIRWPNGEICLAAVFSRDEADRPGATMISLEDERVRGLTNSLPVFAPGQPIPTIFVPEVSDKTSGFWSLWRISLHTTGGREQRFLALFLAEDGRVFGPTARSIWERLIDQPMGMDQAGEEISGSAAADAFDASRKAAEDQGAAVFEELADAHQMGIIREHKKGTHAFSSRRKAIERLGLPQVRAHRLRILEDEEQAWARELATRETALPDLAAVLMVRVAPMGDSA